MMEQSVNQCLAGMTSSGMNHQAGRLVQDDQIVVLKKDIERNLFRSKNGRAWRRFIQFDDIAFPDRLARSRRRSIQPNESVGDQLLQA